MTREEVTQKILAHKLTSGLRWADVAKEIGRSTVFTTAALLGQMALSDDEARTAAAIFDLDDTETRLLTAVPYKGSLGETVPTDPLIYRFYEIVQVYGTTLKEVIQDEFGDGIMSAIDFTMDVDRVADPNGDRVVVTLNGKFLPYRKF